MHKLNQAASGSAARRRARLTRFASRAPSALALALAAICLCLWPQPKAAAQGLPLIRDSEIESLLVDYAKPIFRAAGFGNAKIAVRIVKNDAFNAFVLDGSNVFVHTGTLAQAKTPNEVIGVIAHESGHIAGGHMAALRIRIAKDQTRALLTQIIGIGALIGGAMQGGDAGRDTVGAGGAIMQGGNAVIMRGILQERRSQESAADQAGLKYLNATHQSGRGLLETFERFQQQEYVTDQFQDPFLRSHPVATDRLARLRDLVNSSPYAGATDPPALQLRHDLMKAKLAGYLERPGAVFDRYPVSDKSQPARYARAFATYFKGGQGALEAALAALDGLIKEQPSYAYYYEAKGDLLMRSGHQAQAIAPLRQALKLAPDNPLMRVQLAQALQSGNAAPGMAESVELLRKSLIEDDNPTAYRMLANAYYAQGKGPEADAMTAQAYFLEGNLPQSQIFAKRAQAKLKPGTPEWIKNDDIINYKPQT